MEECVLIKRTIFSAGKTTTTTTKTLPFANLGVGVILHIFPVCLKHFKENYKQQEGAFLAEGKSILYKASPNPRKNSVRRLLSFYKWK